MLSRLLDFLRVSPAADAPESGAGIEHVCLAAGDGGMEAKYALCDPEVLPSIEPLTRDEARDLLADGISSIVQQRGPTKVGAMIGGCDESTVRDARDKKSLLRLDYAFNMLIVDEHALDCLLDHYHKKIVDKDPRPVDWNQLGLAAIDLGAEVMRAKAKGHISHLDLPKLKALARQVLAAGQGAA